MTRRGLTLVELLAAIALLSLIAAGTLPVLTDARRALEPSAAPPVERLAEFADLALANRALLDPDAVVCGEVRRLSWHDVAWPPESAWHPPHDAPPIEFHCLCTGDADERGGWLQFRCGDAIVHRYVEEVRRPGDQEDDVP